MALGFYFSPTTPMNTQQYDECIKRLKKAGAAHPRGRVYHACFGPSDKLAVFDVWTSQEAFDKFGAGLMPIMQELGLDPGQPAVMPIHSVVTPPAARPRAAAAKRAPVKRKAAKTAVNKAKPVRRSAKKR